jgi:phenylalanyl-tRNA synthetase beta chain
LQPHHGLRHERHGFEILPVKVILGEETEFGSEITVPYYFQEPVSCSMAQIHKTLG